MTDHPETTAFYRQRLPHWLVADGVYFVTISAYGAIPREVAEEIRKESKCLLHYRGNDLLERKREILRKKEMWLDRTDAANVLATPPVAQMIQEAIAHRAAREVWRVYAYVIMPSHLHLLVEPLAGELPDVLKDFKRWTGHQGIRLTLAPDKRFWADEWFDHWSRSPEYGEKIVEYIQQNPVKAGLVKDYTEWPYGGWNPG